MKRVLRAGAWQAGAVQDSLRQFAAGSESACMAVVVHLGVGVLAEAVQDFVYLLVGVGALLYAVRGVAPQEVRRVELLVKGEKLALSRPFLSILTRLLRLYFSMPFRIPLIR